MVNVERTMKHAPSWSWTSWSWTSLPAEVGFIRSSNLVATTEVLDIEIKRVSLNFFGSTDSYRLRLRGQICRFHREVQDDSTWIHIGEYTMFQEFKDFEFQGGKSIILSWDTSRHTTSLAANRKL